VRTGTLARNGWKQKRITLSRRDTDLLTEAVMCDKIQGGQPLCTHVWAGYLMAKAGIRSKEMLDAEFSIEFDRAGNARYLLLSRRMCGC
jgi:hypothetical protein